MRIHAGLADSSTLCGTKRKNVRYLGMETQAQNRCILIVEDDPFIAMDLEDTFIQNGYTVIGPVANVYSGLKVIGEHRPDVAMLDYNLGQETSVALAKKLDEHNVPYIFLTGRVSSVLENAELTQPTVVSKPFVPELLIEMVEKLTSH